MYSLSRYGIVKIPVNSVESTEFTGTGQYPIYKVDTELSIQVENGTEVEYELSPLPFILMNLNMNLNSKFSLFSRCEVEFPIQLKPILMN